MALDFGTIALSLVVGLSGGAIAAVISAKAQSSQTTRQAKIHAATSLRTYLRTLGDLLEQTEYSRDQGRTSMGKDTNDLARAVMTAREDAYPFAHYLSTDGQKVMEIRGVADAHGPISIAIADIADLRSRLRTAIDSAFPPGR